VYVSFVAQFASAESKKGEQFYTPSCVVRVLVEVLAPYNGRVYDPSCGWGVMFVSSEKVIEAHSSADCSICACRRSGQRALESPKQSLFLPGFKLVLPNPKHTPAAISKRGVN